MSQETEPVNELLIELLTLASYPDTTPAALLQAVVERAAEVQPSDLGLGIFALEPWNPGRIAVSAATGALAKDFPLLVQSWLERAEGPRRLSAPVLLTPLVAGSAALARSFAWVPLLDGRRTFAGALYLQSSRASQYSDRCIGRLEKLATAALPAIYRSILRERINKAGAAVDQVGISRSFLELERTIRLTARHSKATVLITGERGSGKELVAWAIHGWSQRWNRPFVPVLVSSLAAGLYVDELFGHERSSFTGAAGERSGKFKAADGGTLFLDEVGDLVPEVQSALLRILERGELARIGRDLPLQVDVRVVTATNLDLDQLSKENRFRRDLYDRLSVFEIRVPPLRERREDIPFLVNHIVASHCAAMWRRSALQSEIGCPGCSLGNLLPCATPAFYQALQDYPWPGNIRELRHLILRLMVTVPEEVLDRPHLPPRLLARDERAASEDMSLEKAVKSHIERVLALTRCNQSRAARILGIPLSTLRSKMKKLKIEACPIPGPFLPGEVPSPRQRFV